MCDFPHFTITDDYFNFEEVPLTGINFRAWDTGTTVIKTKDITYFKIVNTETNKNTYWLVKKVNKVLKNGFEVELNLDIYMTYGRHVLKKMIENKKIIPLVERTSYTSSMFYNSETLRNLMIYALRDPDELVDSNFEYTTFEKLRQPIPDTNNGTDWQFKVWGDNRGYFNLIDFYISDGAVKPTEPVETNYDKLYDISLGLYGVFSNPATGKYALVPIMKNVSGRTYSVTFDDTHATTGRKTYIRNSLAHVTYYMIENPRPPFNTKSFIGFYKGPSFGVKGYGTKYINPSLLAITTTPQVGDPDDYKILMYELDVTKPVDVIPPFNLTFNENDSFIPFIVDASQEILWGKNKIKPRDYLSHMNLTTKSLDLECKCLFTDGFFVTFKPTIHSKLEECISFGGILPSATQEYADTVRRAKEGFDMGLGNAIGGFLQAGPAAAGKWAAAPLWGLTAGANSVITLSRDLRNLNLSYKHNISHVSPTYANSNTSDIYYYLQIKTWLSDDPSFTMEYGTGFNNPHRDDFQLYQLAIKYIFSTAQKQHLMNIYNLYGFNCNKNISFNELYYNGNFNRRWYFKLNDVWVATNMKQITRQVQGMENLNIDELSAISDLFINGMRIWFNNNPDYYQYGD